MHLHAPVGQLFGHLNAAELRQIILHRAREVEQSLVHQNHGGDAGDGLGLRHHLHDGIGPHRFFVFDIGESDSVQSGDAAIAAHQRDRAGEVASVDELLRAKGD